MYFPPLFLFFSDLAVSQGPFGLSAFPPLKIPAQMASSSGAHGVGFHYPDFLWEVPGSSGRRRVGLVGGGCRFERRRGACGGQCVAVPLRAEAGAASSGGVGPWRWRLKGGAASRLRATAGGSGRRREVAVGSRWCGRSALQAWRRHCAAACPCGTGVAHPLPLPFFLLRRAVPCGGGCVRGRRRHAAAVPWVEAGARLRASSGGTPVRSWRPAGGDAALGRTGQSAFFCVLFIQKHCSYNAM